MYRIFKYPIELQDEQYIDLPSGFQILTVIEQNGDLMLYAKVLPFAEKETIKIFVRGTGHYIRENSTYLTTIKMGIFIWHIFIKNNA